MSWRITVYEPDRVTPKNLEFSVGPFRLQLYRHRAYLDRWALCMRPCCDAHVLTATDLDAACQEAEDYAALQFHAGLEALGLRLVPAPAEPAVVAPAK